MAARRPRRLCARIRPIGVGTMSFNSFGRVLRFTTWGESHGPALGAVVDGCPPRLSLSEGDIQPFLDKRRPGQSRHTTQRQEPDQVRILSGVFEGKTTGTPISLMIDNVDQRSKDYGDIAQASVLAQALRLVHVLPAACEATAPSASVDHLKARGSPAGPRTRPPPLGGSPCPSAAHCCGRSEGQWLLPCAPCRSSRGSRRWCLRCSGRSSAPTPRSAAGRPRGTSSPRPPPEPMKR